MGKLRGNGVMTWWNTSVGTQRHLPKVQHGINKTQTDPKHRIQCFACEIGIQISRKVVCSCNV